MNEENKSPKELAEMHKIGLYSEKFYKNFSYEKINGLWTIKCIHEEHKGTVMLETKVLEKARAWCMNADNVLNDPSNDY